MIDSTQTQRVIISTTNRRLFVEKIGEMYMKGGVLAPASVPRLTSPFPFQAEFLFTVTKPEEAIKSSVAVHAQPPQFPTFTKEQMEALTWEDFREACGLYGVRGKERQKMLSEYMKATKQKG